MPKFKQGNFEIEYIPSNHAFAGIFFQCKYIRSEMWCMATDLNDLKELIETIQLGVNDTAKKEDIIENPLDLNDFIRKSDVLQWMDKNTEYITNKTDVGYSKLMILKRKLVEYLHNYTISK